MPRRVVFRPQAEKEALVVRQWYDSRCAGLGIDFAFAVEALVERIASMPLAFPRVHHETRRAVLSRFPYAIYFRMTDDEAIVVLAIQGQQHPSRWQTRS